MIMMASVFTVNDLCIYPIKALPGIHVQAAVLDGSGLRHREFERVRDRSFMLVDAGTGKFISLRTHARGLSKISLALDEASGTLELSAPGVDVLRIDVAGVAGDRTHMESSVWEWRGHATVVDREWFTRVVGCELCLVEASNDMHRPVDPDYAPRPSTTGFSDGFPFLFAFRESLVDLFAETYGDAAAGMMHRFRPNLTVAGGAPWQEDGIRELRLLRATGEYTGATFDLCKPCSRCTVPAVDPATGDVDGRVTELLRSRRSGGVLGWTEGPRGFKNATFFGVNACLVDGEGGGTVVVKVGDVLES